MKFGGNDGMQSRKDRVASGAYCGGLINIVVDASKLRSCICKSTGCLFCKYKCVIFLFNIWHFIIAWFIFMPKLHAFGLENPCRHVFCLVRPGLGM